MNLLALDAQLFYRINGWQQGAVLDFVLPFFSNQWILLLGLCIAGLLWFRRDRLPLLLEILLLLSLSVGITDGACGLIKSAVGRARPYQALSDVHYVEYGKWSRTPAVMAPPRRPGSSFLSGHAANSMAIVCVLSWCVAKMRWWILLVPLLVGWSRVYLGRHYPLDVLSGWVLGATLATLICSLWFRYRGLLPLRMHFWKTESR